MRISGGSEYMKGIEQWREKCEVMQTEKRIIDNRSREC